MRPALRGQPLDVKLGHAFGGAHDRRRVHGIVGTDHHEAFASGGVGRVGDRAGSEKIVSHRLVGMLLHHWHMLVGRGVEDHLRTVRLKQLLGAGRVGHVVQQGQPTQVGDVGQLPVDFKEAVFGTVHQQQGRGPVGRGKGGDLRTDASAGAGDQDGFAFQDPPDRLLIQRVRLSAEQAVGALRAAPGGAAAVELIGGRGQRTDLHRKIAQLSAQTFRQIGHHTRQAEVGGGNAVLADQPTQVFRGAERTKARPASGGRADRHRTDQRPTGASDKPLRVGDALGGSDDQSRFGRLS